LDDEILTIENEWNNLYKISSHIICKTRLAIIKSSNTRKAMAWNVGPVWVLRLEEKSTVHNVAKK